MNTWRQITLQPLSDLFDDCRGLEKAHEKLASRLADLNQQRGKHDDQVAEYLRETHDDGSEPLHAQHLSGQRNSVLRRELNVLQDLASYQRLWNETAAKMQSAARPAIDEKQAELTKQLDAMGWDLANYTRPADKGPINAAKRSLVQAHPSMARLWQQSRFNTRLRVDETEQALEACSQEIRSAKERALQAA